MNDLNEIGARLIRDNGESLYAFLTDRGWLTLFLGYTWEEYHTGGGCMALRLDLPDGHEALITEEEGVDIPVPGEDVIILGFYDDDQQQIAAFEHHP